MQVFKELDHDYLKKYARRWKKNCSDIPIARIVLYEYLSKNTEGFKTLFPHSQSPLYVVVFEVPGLKIESRTNWVSWDTKNQEEEESIYKKIRNRFNIPDKIPNQGVLEYIGDNYDEEKSFYHKVRERFKVPKNIPNQGILEYIKANHDVKVKKPPFLETKDIEAFEKASKMLKPFKNKRNFISKMDNTNIAYRRESIFISAYRGFKNVYKQTAGDNFYLDWCFIAVPPEGPLPDYFYVDDSCFWILWDRNKPMEKKAGKSDVNVIKKDDEVYDTQIKAEMIFSDDERVGDIPQEVIDFVTRVKPQVIEVYNSLKKGPGWKMGDNPKAKNARMEDALNFYVENQTRLSNLFRKVLKDPNLYERSYGQEKRDIVGRIIKRSVELNDLGRYSARKLYKVY